MMLERALIFLVAGALSGISGASPVAASGRQEKPSSSNQAVPATFEDNISPLLKENCTPCHYKGGKVYAKLPFDKYETVRALGKKLNTRLKGENADLVTRWIREGSLEEPKPQKKMP
jgi:hypothetical protein